MVADELPDEAPHQTDRGLDPDGRNPGRSRRAGGGWFWAGLAVGAVAAVAVLLLIVQNPESTDFEWFTGDFTAPLWALLALSAVAGAIVWTIVVALIREAADLRAQRSGVARAERRARTARERRPA